MIRVLRAVLQSALGATRVMASGSRKGSGVGGAAASGSAVAAVAAFYAVRRGRSVGVFRSWPECEQLVKGFTGARYKKFSTLAEANLFVSGIDNPSPTTSTSQQDSSSKQSTAKVPTKATKRAAAPGNASTNHVAATAAKAAGGPKAKRLRKSSQNGNQSDADEDAADRPVVYTDGACSNNGYKGAKAGIGVYWGDGDKRNVSEPLTGRPTNNRAEIHAAVRAIGQAKELGFTSLEIRTDSIFLINSVTKWIPGWKRKDWKTSAGKPVINQEDFEKLLEARNGIDVRWTHVRGHAGIHGNEMADKLAVAGMEHYQSSED